MIEVKAGEVVWVSFPHVEIEQSKVRPALVISNRLIGPTKQLLWAMMITNALRPDWPGDLVIEDYLAVGLPHPSKIRTAKIATLEAAGAERIGSISVELLAQVRRILAATLDI